MAAIGAEYGAYRSVLAEQADIPPSQWTFKSNLAYQVILEHVSPEQGKQYLAVIQQDFPKEWHAHRNLLIRTAKENDRLGSPAKADFPELGIECSPTNLRYMHQALLFWRHVQSLGLKAIHVIEIGGGYGGLALYLRRLAPTVPCILRSHTIVDVLEAGAIQKAYALACTIPIRTVDGMDRQALEQVIKQTENAPRVLVSAYGFSEFSAQVQAWYRETIVQHCQHGLLVWNFIPVYPFTEAPLTVEPERPLTGPGNKLVRF